MKNIILFVVITIVIVLYILSQNFILKIETFESDNPFMGIGVLAESNKLYFYHPQNSSEINTRSVNQTSTTTSIPVNNKYKIIQVPNKQNPENIKDYSYEKQILIVLTELNNIYYCNQCDLLSGRIRFTKLVIPTSVTNIRSISLDTETTNKVVILADTGIASNQIYACDNFTMPRSPVWTEIKLNGITQDTSFTSIDAQYGQIVGIGKTTNFIYRKTLLNAIKNTGVWDILDKSKMIQYVKITSNGYYGKTSDNKMVKCDYPCTGNGVDKWSAIENDFFNDSLTNIISENLNIIAYNKSNKLYSCDRNNCSFTSNQQESNLESDAYDISKGKAITFVYPSLIRSPQIDPLPVNEIEKINKNLDSYNESYNNLQVSLNKLLDKISLFNNVQDKFKTDLNKLRSDRDIIIDILNSKIVPPPTSISTFVDLPPIQPVNFSAIKEQIKSQIDSQSTDPKEKIVMNDSLIIAI
jgi:hypothetical protein